MSTQSGYAVKGRLDENDEINGKTRNVFKKEHVTTPPKGINRTGMDVVAGGYAEVAIEILVEADSNESIVHVTAHGYLKGDVIRLTTTANLIEEREMFVGSVIDADHVQLYAPLSAPLTVGDEIEILRYVLPKVAPDGSSLATLSAGPVRILRGPNGVFDPVEVTKDTADIANTIAMPVEIVSATGTEVIINAGDINVQTSRLGVNHDSVRHGNNDVEQAYTDLGGGIGASRVEDLLSQAELQAILAKIIAAPSTEAKQDIIVTALATLDTELKLKADLTETQPVSIASAMPLPTGASTEAKQDALIAEMALKADLTETQPVSMATQPLPTGAATEVTLAALLVELALKADLTETQPTSAIQLPATLGQKIAADSLGVTQSAEDFAVQTAIKDALEAQLAASTIDVRAAGLNENATNNITGAELVVIADTGSKACTEIKIACTFGAYMDLMINGVGKAIVPKGGFSDGALKIAIPANATVGFRKRGAIADITAGEIIINVMG